MTQKIVINVRHGGFGLSEQAETMYRELTGKPFPEYRWEVRRDCPHLVQVVEYLGELANGQYANLKVVEIPDGVVWHVDEHDTGIEWIRETHRIWR